MTANDTLISGAAAFGIEITPEQVGQFNTYSNFLVEYNKNVNLTRITDPADIAEKHFVDSIAPLKWADIKQDALVIDVGTGAGFPGIPLRIVRPDIRLTLLDSLQKRLDFLEKVSAMLGQQNSLVHARAEIGGIDPALRGHFDVAVSRAVARLSVLCEYCLPYVRVGGFFLALKGPDPGDELRDAAHAISLLGGGQAQVTNYSLPCGDGRTLILIPKERPTPKAYPRQRVKISDRPL